MGVASEFGRTDVAMVLIFKGAAHLGALDLHTLEVGVAGPHGAVPPQ